jgi:EAL and modified HD-GYP domain-containing signal transduction protein
MSEYFIARQPILDRDGALYAYELLFRDSEANAAPRNMDHNAATADILTTSGDVGLASLVGQHHAFINLPERFLDEPDLLPLAPQQLVLEVLEDVEFNEKRLSGMRQLKERGFALALDDFVYDPRFEEALALVDIVKLEVPALAEERWEEEISRLRDYDVRVLAEKVETEQEFQRLHDLGCDLFQGYFFARPRLLRGRRLNSNQLALLQLLSRLNDPDLDIDDLAQLVDRDLALSVRVINHVQSAASALNRKVESVREAVVYLGRDRIRNLVALLLMARSGDKPAALMSIALVRAKFCELIAADEPGGDPGAYFTAGLFSVLDAMMDVPMAEVVDKLPVSNELVDALVGHSGPMGRALSMAIAIERDDPIEMWCDDAQRCARQYRAATQWSEEVLGATELS